MLLKSSSCNLLPPSEKCYLTWGVLRDWPPIIELLLNYLIKAGFSVGGIDGVPKFIGDNVLKLTFVPKFICGVAFTMPVCIKSGVPCQYNYGTDTWVTFVVSDLESC